MGFLFENSKMPEREIIKRAHRIKPVYYDARVGSLMFTPTADISMSKEDLSAGCVVSALELKPLAEYSFAHHQDFTALSTPSVKDVLSSLPDDIIHSACAVNCEYLEYDTVQLRHMFKVTV